MKCNHVHKDAPENAQCEDCGTDNNLREDEMKGGNNQDDRKNNKLRGV